MARFSHLPIYKKSFTLLTKIEEVVLGMDRRARYTIGTDLRNIFREFITDITRVNSMQSSSQRLECMDKMFDLVNQVYILLSVMKELKMFKNKDHYEIIIEDVFNIEKQLEGWRSSLKNDKC